MGCGAAPGLAARPLPGAPQSSPVAATSTIKRKRSLPPAELGGSGQCAAGAQTLAAGPSWGAYWNYLRRQLYVMDTWAGAHNRRLNHGMLALHCWLSWALVFPALAGVSPPFLPSIPSPLPSGGPLHH